MRSLPENANLVVSLISAFSPSMSIFLLLSKHLLDKLSFAACYCLLQRTLSHASLITVCAIDVCCTLQADSSLQNTNVKWAIPFSHRCGELQHQLSLSATPSWSVLATSAGFRLVNIRMGKGLETILGLSIVHEACHSNRHKHNLCIFM